MPTIEIDKKPKIYDDPILCENEDIDCAHLSTNRVDNRQWCLVFGKYVDDSDKLMEKCDECKEAHKKAVNARKTESDHRTQHQKQMEKHMIG